MYLLGVSNSKSFTLQKNILSWQRKSQAKELLKLLRRFSVIKEPVKLVRRQQGVPCLKEKRAVKRKSSSSMKECHMALLFSLNPSKK